MKSQHNILKYAVMFLFLALIVEGISYMGEVYLVRRGIAYKQKERKDYDDYLLGRDPLLGWPSPESYGKGKYDSSGSRIVPAFPDPHDETCVSLYGDSYTWGSEVLPEYTWGNVLSSLLNCRVSNSAVGGYGTDQSFLRFRDNEQDQAKIVILCHSAENIVRNVTQFFDQVYGSDGFALKPRFIIDETGSLKLVPIPKFSRDEFNRMLNNPERFLEKDCLVPGGPLGTYKAGFPFSLSVLRAFNHFRVKARLAGKPFWASFYEYDHPCQGLQITALIMKSFYQEVRRKGKTPVVVLLPWERDLISYKKDGTWAYQPLMDKLFQDNIAYLNVGPGLIEELGPREPCRFFKSCGGGHYNEAAHEVVAGLVRDYLCDEAYLCKKDIVSDHGSALSLTRASETQSF